MTKRRSDLFDCVPEDALPDLTYQSLSKKQRRRVDEMIARQLEVEATATSQAAAQQGNVLTLDMLKDLMRRLEL